MHLKLAWQNARNVWKVTIVLKISHLTTLSRVLKDITVRMERSPRTKILVNLEPTTIVFEGPRKRTAFHVRLVIIVQNGVRVKQSCLQRE